MSSWYVEACSWYAYELEGSGERRGYDIGVLVWKVRELLCCPVGGRAGEQTACGSPCFSK